MYCISIKIYALKLQSLMLMLRCFLISTEEVSLILWSLQSLEEHNKLRTAVNSERPYKPLQYEHRDTQLYIARSSIRGDGILAKIKMWDTLSCLK